MSLYSLADALSTSLVMIVDASTSGGNKEGSETAAELKQKIPGDDV